MSLRNEPLVVEGSSTVERVASGLAAVGAALALVGLLVIFRAVRLDAPVAGVTVADLLGGALLLAGVGVVGLGLTSKLGGIDTTPDRTTGLVPAVLFGAIGFVGGGLVGAQTLGLSTLWPVVALVVGVLAAAVTVLPREDLGTTLPSGALAVVVGLVVLTGVIGPDWSWHPEGLSATFTGPIAIAVLSMLAGFTTSWTAAKAYDGFGTRGRQAGAYMLVSANAAGMLAVLALLVAFVASKGLGPALQGIRYGLFTRPVYWFYFPPIEEYVIFSAPGIWFHWPFVMRGASLGSEITGVAPAIVGTVWLVVGAVLFAVPLGVGAAVFLTEYAEQGRFTQLVEISTNGLWSTPSIVYGLFGLVFLVPRLGNTTSILSGQLVLGFMLLPLVVITSRESLKSVPDEYRDASAALGVGKWETIKSVVLPAAMPGVITGVILGVGRIAGETAPILLVTAGAPFPSNAPDVLGSFRFTTTFPFVTNRALLEPASALPYQLYAVITAGVGGNEGLGWGTAFVLLLVVLGFYAIGIASRIYFRRKLEA